MFKKRKRGKRRKANRSSYTESRSLTNKEKNTLCDSLPLQIKHIRFIQTLK